MPVKLPRLAKSTRGWPWVTYRDVKGNTKRARVLAVGSDTTRSVTIQTTKKSVTVTTTIGVVDIVATVGTFDAAVDVGAVVTGNDGNTGAGRTIASVQDATHAKLSAAAAATDAVGAATDITQRAIVLTVGALDTTRDVGATLSGNNTNTGVGRTIVSVQDATHAVMSAPALVADAGTATNITRLRDQGSVKVKVPHRKVADAILDNLPEQTVRTQTGRVLDRRGPA